MKAGIRSRLFAFISLFMLSLQFPFAELNVPVRYQNEPAVGKVQMSVIQVAVAGYHQAGTSLPSSILKACLAPGMIAHDMFNQFSCTVEKNKGACNAPKAMAQYDNAFEVTQPLCNPKIIMGVLRRNFPKSIELIQAGAAVTVGSALFSLLYPIKFGFFGYLMIMFALYTDGVTPFLPGLAFLPIFAIATDVGSIFKHHLGRAPEAPEEPTEDAKDDAGGVASSDKGAKRTNNKKKKRV